MAVELIEELRADGVAGIYLMPQFGRFDRAAELVEAIRSPIGDRSEPQGSGAMTVLHLAQVNVARLAAPLDSPQLADFVANLEPINAIADASPGFVWRLQTETGDATSLRIFDDDWIIVNMSVWESLEALRDYVYRSAHADVLRRRQEWFEQMSEAHRRALVDRGRHAPDDRRRPRTVDDAPRRRADASGRSR